jgi:hypothetical protein
MKCVICEERADSMRVMYEHLWRRHYRISMEFVLNFVSADEGKRIAAIPR